MGFRFWKRIRLGPGVVLNLSKTGMSVSFGGRGSRLTIGPRGRRVTMGIPGTGLFYTTKLPSRAPGGGRTASRHIPRPPRPEERLQLGFFERLVTPTQEKELVDGCRELVAGDKQRALELLGRASHLADAAYLAGFLALEKGRLEDARRYLTTAAENHARLGRYLSKYGVSIALELPITEEISARVGPNLRGVLLGLVEVHQRLKERAEAIACLERLRRLEPGDIVVRLSLAELLLEARPGDAEACRQVARLAEGVENEGPVHAALMLYAGRALRALGRLDEARRTLGAALRRRKGRSAELLAALRRERELVDAELRRGRRLARRH